MDLFERLGPFPAQLPPGHQRRKSWLHLHHPEGSPSELFGDPDYLLHPPSRLAPTAAWIDYRDGTLLGMIETRPDDPDLPNYLVHVEKVLAWRPAVRAEDRFWKPDAPFYHYRASGFFRRRLIFPIGSEDSAYCLKEARRFIRLYREEIRAEGTAQKGI
jgi:hypothetical protein